MSEINADEMRAILQEVIRPILEQLSKHGDRIDAMDNRINNSIQSAIQNISEVMSEHRVLESKFISHENRQDREIEEIKGNMQNNWTYTYSLNEKLNQLNNSIELIKESNKTRDTNMADMKAEDSWIKQNIAKILFTLGGGSGFAYTAFKVISE